MPRTLGTGFLVALSLLVLAAPARALTVTLRGSPPPRLFTTAGDGELGHADEEVNPTSLPFVYAVSSIGGAARAISSFDFSNTGFDFAFDHAVTDLLGSLASAQGRDLLFTVDDDADYVASGAYSVVDPEGGGVVQFARLDDETAGSEIFFAYQESRGAPDVSFVLGLEEGTLGNAFRGSLTGTLIAGHEYRLTYIYEISSLIAPSDATAVGAFSIVLVPEPGMGVLLAVALAAAALLRSR